MSTDSEQVQPTGNEDSEANTALVVQPMRGVKENDKPPIEKQNKSAVYVQDWWERLPVRRQAAAIGLVAIALVVVAPFSGSPVVGFLVGAALALFVGFIALNQYYIAKRQWWVMERGLTMTEEAMEHAKNALEIVERPIIIVESADFRFPGNSRLEPEVTIENKGRTGAENIRMKLGVAIEPLFGEKFDVKYPDHASPEWCERVFLAPNGVAHLSYNEADSATSQETPGNSWVDEIVIYGFGSYEGMGGNEYPIPKFAFRVVATPGEARPYSLIRDFRLANIWVNQDKESECENTN